MKGGGFRDQGSLADNVAAHAGFVHTPRRMEGNEKPVTYPPAMHEKQRQEREKGPRQGGIDLEGGERRDDDDAQDMDELEGGLGEHAFHHPALYKPQVSK